LLFSVYLIKFHNRPVACSSDGGTYLNKDRILMSLEIRNTFK
jgi:hypothetical protein